MHSLLSRQLRRIVGEQFTDLQSLPSPWLEFVKVVGQAYEAADADRELIESSMEIASQELFERNGELTKKHERLEAVEQQLRQSHDELEQRVKERTTQLEAALEQAQSASRAKSSFLANMSHEIRTPMTAIMGYADMLSTTGQGVKERLEYVQTIRQQGEHLLSVLNDILDLSKIEANKLEVERLSCDPSQVIAEAISLMRVRAIEKKLTCEVNYVGQIPATVETDPTRFRQILLNLLGNAIKFTEAGGVQVNVSAAFPAQDDGDATLRVEVVDSGIGMTDEQMSILFVPFGQADGSMTRRFGGTGLGLSICKRLTQMLGGDVTVQSKAGCGSRFTATLNAGKMRNIRRVQFTAESSRGNVDHGQNNENSPLTGRVLLAEDGIHNQRVFRYFLEAAGLQVEIAGNGRIATERALSSVAQGAAFDVILMDMQMPEMDGYGAASLLRASSYTGPIIAITAHAMAGDREKCLAAGCSDYLTKPINRDLLIATVARNLRAGGSKSSVPPEAPLKSQVVDPGITHFLPGFVEDLPTQVEHLCALQREADVDGLARLLHALKGTSGMFGFPEINERAAGIESRLQAGASAIAEVERDVAGLVNLVRRVEGFGVSATAKPSHGEG